MLGAGCWRVSMAFCGAGLGASAATAWPNWRGAVVGTLLPPTRGTACPTDTAALCGVGLIAAAGLGATGLAATAGAFAAGFAATGLACTTGFFAGALPA